MVRFAFLKFICCWMLNQRGSIRTLLQQSRRDGTRVWGFWQLEGSVIFTKHRCGHFTPLLRILLMAPHYPQDEDSRPPSILSALGLTNFPFSEHPASPSCSLFLYPPSSIALPCLWCSLCLAWPPMSQDLLLILKVSFPSSPLLWGLPRLPPLKQNLVF